MIWPYHVLIGTPGHNLTPALYEAIAFHTAARHTQPEFLTKGTIPKTEHYSILEPEVKVPEAPLGTVNTDFLGMLSSHDLIYVAGQAKSHCVLETVASMMQHLAPEDITKIRVLTDCASSVAHPEIDFDAMADEAFARFEKDGLTLVKSTDDIG
jgi:nicotinamidase-related amidase